MRTKEEILTNIEEVMTKYVTPNVAAHGGKVNVLGFDMNTGILSTQLSGSCSGCASSAATLKMGIENTLMHFIPEITEVTGEDDPDFNQPYYSDDGGYPDFNDY